MIKVKAITIVLTLILLVGCQSAIIDNKMYPVGRPEPDTTRLVTGPPIITEGYKPFVSGLKTDKLKETDILITASLDGKTLYAMESLPHTSKTIKGDLALPVKVWAVDAETGARKVVIDSMPFVTLAKWNPQGTILAMSGSEVLRLWDAANQRELMRDTLTNTSAIVFFGWSPDGKRIYTEHSSLPNGQILYVETGEQVQPYQTKENLYFMGQLDDERYIARYRTPMSEDQIKYGGGEKYETVITDRDGKIIKSLVELNTRFRGAFGNALISVGFERFGLLYKADINKSAQAHTECGFVHDLKFVADGQIAYITSSDQPEKNDFVLRIIDPTTNKTHEMMVSGSSIALHPDGKTGVIGGPIFETIDFTTHTITATREVSINSELEAIHNSIRGALNVLLGMDYAEDHNLAKQYLVNSSNPEQWALFDVLALFNDNNYKDPRDTAKNTPTTWRYALTLKIDNTPKISTANPNRASVVVGAHYASYTGSGSGRSFPLELIKMDGKWYVTGFSTFPNSQQSKDVRKVVEQTVTQAIAGNATFLFSSELQNKDVTIGQIQLWMMSEPHWSPNVEWSNYAKAYLTVKDGNSEFVYKLVLKKQNNTWQVQSLKKEYLSGL